LAGVGKIPRFTANQVAKTFQKFNISGSFFLTLGTLKPNKNIPFLLSAFAQTSGHKLVIAGKKGWLYHDIFAQVKKLHLDSRVVFTNYITQDEKWILLQNAVATVLPSTYEGFGIPAIESLYAGTPVIASDIPAFREILSDGVTYINPELESELVRALELFKSKKSIKVVPKYSWSNSAKSLIELLSRI
jgi:glycosyltransferase involved in cell wall biosynthesis